jgi:hypothetical protein
MPAGSESGPGSDPAALSVLAVTTADAVAALEANLRRDRGLVLRVTPPFHGRQRARLHRPLPDEDDEGEPVVLDPERLFVDPPAYPTVDETADALRAQGAYSPDRHRERHVGAVEEWRESLRDARVDSVPIDAPGGPHEVRVAWLG